MKLQMDRLRHDPLHSPVTRPNGIGDIGNVVSKRLPPRFRKIQVLQGPEEGIPGITEQFPRLFGPLKEKAQRMNATLEVFLDIPGWMKLPAEAKEGSLIIVLTHANERAGIGHSLLVATPKIGMPTHELAHHAREIGAAACVVFACKARRAADAIARQLESHHEGASDARHLPPTLLIGGRGASSAGQNASDMLQLVDWALEPKPQHGQPDDLEMFLWCLETSPQCVHLLLQSDDGHVHSLHAPGPSKTDFAGGVGNIASVRLNRAAGKANGKSALLHKLTLAYANRPSALRGKLSLDDAFRQRVFRNDLQGAQILLEEHVDVNASDLIDIVALHRACEHQSLELTKVLIQAGADVNGRTHLGATPLAIACEAGNIEIARHLIEAGADPDIAMTSGFTPLHFACRSGGEDLAVLLIGAGANVDAMEKSGYTPFLFACQNGNERIVGQCIEAGGDVEFFVPQVFTLLGVASRLGHGRVVELLIDAGADVNKVDSFGNTPLYYACRYGHAGVAERLLDAGADMHRATNVDVNLLDIAADHIEVKNLLAMRLMKIRNRC